MVNLEEEEIAMLDVSWAIAKENSSLNLTCIEALISNSRRIAGLKKINRAVLAQQVNLDVVDYICEKEALERESDNNDNYRYRKADDYQPQQSERRYRNDFQDFFGEYYNEDKQTGYQYGRKRNSRIFSG